MKNCEWLLLWFVLPGVAVGGMRESIVTSGERRVHVAAQAGAGEGLEAQTRDAMAKLNAALSAAQVTRADLVRLDVNLLRSEDPAAVRRILSREFRPGSAPNLLILPIGALPVRGSVVQIAGMAVAAAKPGADGVLHLRNAALSVAQSRGVLYLSGQNDSAVGRHEVITDMGELVRRCMQGLQIALKGGGAAMRDTENVVVYMSSLEQLDKVREVYLSYFEPGNAPATSYVARSAREGATPWVEIDAEAAMPAGAPAPEWPEFLNPAGLTPSSVYTYVVRVRAGRTLYMGAQSEASPGESQAQAQAVYERFEGLLRAAGCDFNDVVKVRAFPVAAKGVMAGINAVRAKFYRPGRPPASTLLGWDATGIPGAQMQIDAVAVCR